MKGNMAIVLWLHRVRRACVGGETSYCLAASASRDGVSGLDPERVCKCAGWSVHVLGDAQCSPRVSPRNKSTRQSHPRTWYFLVTLLPTLP
jgi:hypothetical protein